MDTRKIGDLTVDEFRAVLAEALGAVRTGTASAPRAEQSTGPAFPNYGRHKNEPIHGADVETLTYYANGCRRSLADASKSKWHAKEKALLMAIEAEIERQRRGGGGGGATAAGTRAAMDAAGGGQGFGGSGSTEWTGGDGSDDDSDVPF